MRPIVQSTFAALWSAVLVFWEAAALLKHLISQLAEVFDRSNARVMAVLLLLGLVGPLLFALGLFSLEQLQQWQRLLSVLQRLLSGGA